ncbi:MAG: Ig-like domain-containing protein, partial [Methanobrevibacter sp.]|nr:Ig-like domain-containing protein [Methanobrevibacter sp.]
YGTNGTWWAVHTFDAYGEYKVNASYVGLDNVTVNDGTITINKVNSTIILDNIVLDYGETKNVTVTTTGSTGITAKIDGNNVTVINNYTIQIPVLDAGTYNLTVTTIPDDDHNPVTKEVNITVNKVNSTLTVSDIIFDYGSSGSTVVSLTGADGVNATVVGQPKTVVKVNGTNITVSDLDAGTYTLTVTAIADKNHNNITMNATITVNKVNGTLTVNDVVLDYGESKNITVTTEGATGITAKIDGVNVTVSNYTIPISGLSAGNYTLTVTTIADKNHNPVTKEANINVNKVESTLTVDDIVFDYGSEGSGDVSFTGASEVTANVVNQPSAVVSVSGNKISVSGLGAGTYTLNVTTVPDENHTSVTETATLSVNKVNSSLTLDDVVLDYGESKNITVTTEGATDITAKIDGVNVTVNGYTIPISGLGAGNHTLSVTTIADKNHNPVTKEVNITVNKLSTEIILANETLDLKVGDEVTDLANLTPAGAGNLTFTSSDEDLVYIDDDGIVIGNGQGQAIITVSFAGNENYTAAENKTITVNVALNDASVSVENDTLNLKVDETYAINATIKPDTIMLKIKYTSSNESVATVDKNGIVTAVGEGTAIITLEVGDNEIYAKNSTTVTVNVKDNTVNVSASDLTKYYNGPESFVVTVTDSKNNPLANQSVIINVAGVNYTRTTDANGTASIAISLISGQYNVTTIVGNNTVYSTVTVLPTVNATDLVKVFRNTTQFYATFKDSQGNYLADGTMVRFNINGVMYDRKVSGNNGFAKLNINLEQGQYIITSMNLETGENAANNVTVISRLIENKELVKYYRNATQYTVKVIGDDGNAVGAGEIVTFNVNGVLYNRTTNESGIAKLNINLHPGDYIITAEYKDCRVSNNIKVLPVLTAKDLTKKYGTPDQFIAKLVDGTGKALSGETVQFNINGVFYNRVTDSNGQSKLNIRLMPGKYVITYSYNGTNIANTITISA